MELVTVSVVVAAAVVGVAAVVVVAVVASKVILIQGYLTAVEFLQTQEYVHKAVE